MRHADALVRPLAFTHSSSSYFHRNTQIIDTCIVFPSWHIHSKAAFVFSFLIIVALGVFYEYLRAFSRNVDLRIASSLAKNGKGKSRILLGGSRSGSGRSTPEEDSDEAGLLSGRTLRPAVSGSVVIHWGCSGY